MSSSLIKTHIPTSCLIKTHTQVIALMKAHTRASGERQVPAPRLQQTIRISTDFHVHGSRAHAREPTRICACNCFKPFSLLHPQHPLTVPSSLISRSVLVNSCPCQDVHVSHPFRFSFRLSFRQVLRYKGRELAAFENLCIVQTMLAHAFKYIYMAPVHKTVHCS